MPPCEAQYLVRYLFKIGPSEAIPFTEIDAWQRCTGIRLSGWEAEQIHQLSLEYLHQQHLARDPDCPPPWGEVVEAVKLSKTEIMRKNLRALAQ
jgi:hypothetical protein